MSTNKEKAIEIISKYAKAYKNQKYVFIDNNKPHTNIIITGRGQKYYMMISWFTNIHDYNFLFLNSLYSDVMYEIITNECKSELYNIVGISYGAAIAIYLSNKIPTGAVVSIDPIPIELNFDLDNIFIIIIYNNNIHIINCTDTRFI